LSHTADVTIIDLSGKELKTWSGKNKIECNISTYQAGNYLVNINTGNKTIIKQVTKK
jgi:hypothetical protein